MPATNQNVTHYEGDSAILRIGPVLDEDGVAVDLTDATLRWWMAKKNTATAAEDVYIEKETGDGLEVEPTTDGGVVVVTLDPEDTEGLKAGVWYHECELVDGDGNVSTIMIGKFTLVPTVIANS